jgi:hypothetical protein
MVSGEISPNIANIMVLLVVVLRCITQEFAMKKLLLAGLSTVSLLLSAAVTEISNEVLTVRFDNAANTFTIANKGAKPFATNGRLEGTAVKAVIVNEEISEFGPGQKIEITQADGSVASLELCQGLPFVLVSQMLKNNGTEPTDFQRRQLASFTLDLGKPASKLKTMGTGGLLDPDKNPGSYLFLTCADPATRQGVVAGWISQDRASGVLFSEVKGGQVAFQARLDYGHLRIAPGASARLETLAIGHFADARIGEELYADAIKKHYNIKLRPQVTGYCTWYSEVGGLTDAKGGAGASNEKDIKTLTEFAAQEMKPFGFNFVQIDDEWQDGASNPDGTRINGPRRGFTRHKPDGSYPHGMAPTAAMIRQNGLTAGLWFLPFARNHQDPEYKNRRHWFVNRQDGMPYETTWGGTSLDITHPEVQAHLAELAKTIHGWGYTYFKMDGLWTGSATEQVYVNDGYKEDHIGFQAPFHDPNVTNIEAQRLGLKTLRQAAGDEVFFSGCCASQSMRSIAGAIGLVDSMRVGPDNGFEWQDYRKETMHFEGGGIITGPIRANRLYFLHGRVWWNDPDPAYVRPAVKLNHAQLLASWIAIAGAFNLNSDWMPGLPPERLDILKRCMPSHHAQARPVDYFETSMPSIWLLSDTRQPVRRDVIGLYNWESTARTITYDAAKAGLDGTKTYHAFDFWNKQPLGDFKGEFKFDVPAESCRVIAVRADEGHPVLVSTSRHVTQGIVDVTDEKWKDETLSATSQVVGNDPYEIRIANDIEETKEFHGCWRFISSTVSDADKAAGVTITRIPYQPRPLELSETVAPWHLFQINSPTSRPVQWTLKFEKMRYIK